MNLHRYLHLYLYPYPLESLLLADPQREELRIRLAQRILELASLPSHGETGKSRGPWFWIDTLSIYININTYPSLSKKGPYVYIHIQLHICIYIHMYIYIYIWRQAYPSVGSACKSGNG